MKLKRQTVSNDSVFEFLLFHSFLYNFFQLIKPFNMSKTFIPQ